MISLQKRITMKRFLILTIFFLTVVISYSQTTLPLNLRCDLIEHTDYVFINGEVSQIRPDEINEIVEPVQIAEINNKQPAFSWSINDNRENILQTAFRVQVSLSPRGFDNDSTLLWDSGRITSETSHAKYDGKELQPETAYFWRVKIWNNRNEISQWSSVKTFRAGTKLEEYSSAFYPLQQWDEKPVRTKQISKNIRFYDFGKAAFGRISLTVDSKAETDTLVVSIGEVITKDCRINSDPGGARRYRKIKLPLIQGIHTYRITIKKDERNTRQAAIKMPDYIGDVLPFRYCEIEGKADITDIKREAVSYYFDDYSSNFSCSDTVMNAIWDFCKYSVKATSFAGIYVDGDRERIPYEADAYINQLCHYGVDNEYTLARRSMEYMLFHPTWPTEWILSSVLMAWKDYLYTGNTDFIREYYDVLKNKTLTELTDRNGLISTRTGKLTKEVLAGIHFNGTLKDIVDWPHSGILGLSNDDSGETDGFVFTDYNTVVNAYHYKALVLMGKMAEAIGKTDDSRMFAEKAAEHKKAFNKLLFDKKKRYYNDGVDTGHSSLHSNMFALTFGLVPKKHVKTVLKFIQSRGMACSVYGSQHLLDAVYEARDAAYGLQLLTNKSDRGWYHAIYDVGTTISLEAWDNKYKPNQDWNHAWGAAPANIIPMKLMGIEPIKPGFESIRIKPQIDTLKWAKIKCPSIKGDILLSIENDPEKVFKLDVTLPANTKDNEVWLPDNGNSYTLTMNGTKIKAKREKNFLVVEGLGSGRYEFRLTRN